MAAGAAIVAMFFATTAPAELAVANMVLRGGFAAGVTLTASRSRRWTWLVLSGVAALVAENGLWLGVAGIGLAVAFASVLRPRRRAYGALATAFGVQAMFHATALDLGRARPLVCLAGVAPILLSGYRASPGRVRRKIHLAVLAVAGVAVSAGVLFGVSAALAYSSTKEGARLARDGLDMARNGKTEQAATLLGASATDLRDANGLLSAFWVKPSLAIPGLAQQARALDVGTAQGARLAEQGAVTARKVDYESLKYTKGRADHGRIRDAQEPLRLTAAAFDEADSELSAVRSDVLVGPVRTQIDELLKQVRDARSDARTASMAADVAPGLLGGDGVRNYFVMFTTPAELRGLGGFMGNWAILTASNGKVSLGESGRADDLNEKLKGRDIVVREPDDYYLRYQRWHVGNHVQDVTVSPDFPSVARVITDIYPQAGGIKVDGAILIDPHALAALLDITGPITVEGYDDTLRADNVVDVLLNRQYVAFTDRKVRERFLDAAVRRPFEKLIDMSLPSPRALGEKLGPPVAQRHLMFWTFNQREQGFLKRVGASGQFGSPAPDEDFFAITTQNSANNKIDVFADRRIDYRVQVDPTTGALTTKAKVTITNHAPASGLPDAVIASNDQSYPLGTSAMYFSFYTPQGLRQMRVGGEQRGVEYQKEVGQNVYSTRLYLPPGGSAVVELDLFGTVTPGNPYYLRYIPQPTVKPDDLTVEVVPSPLWLVQRAEADQRAPFGADIDGSRAVLSTAPKTPVELSTWFHRR